MEFKNYWNYTSRRNFKIFAQIQDATFNLAYMVLVSEL